MGKWELVSVSEVTNILDNKRVPITASERRSGKYPYYGANGVQDYIDNFIFDDELVLLAEDGGNFGSATRPMAYRVSGKCWVNNHAHVLKPKENLDVDYLCYSIMFYDVLPLISGTTRAKLNKSALSKMLIPLPPLDIQKRIAAALDTANALIEKRKEQIEKLDFLIKSQFIEMFGDPVTNPKGWSVNSLAQHLKVIGGYTFKSTGYTMTGIPVLRIGNINTGTLTLNDLVYWTYTESLERYFIYPGDLVMSLTGTVGKDDYANVCVLPAFFDRYYLNQRNAKLNIFGDLSNMYLLYLLRNKEIKKKLTGISRGIRQANISNSDILSLNVPIPPLSLQNQFAEFVEKVEAQKALLQKSLADMEQNYQSLLQKCFKGEIF